MLASCCAPFHVDKRDVDSGERTPSTPLSSASMMDAEMRPPRLKLVLVGDVV